MCISTMLNKMFHLFLKDKMQTRHLCIDFVVIKYFKFHFYLESTEVIKDNSR